MLTKLPFEEWLRVKPPLLPLLVTATERIPTVLKQLRAYDGQRLPSSDWAIVRKILFERDGHVCTYCGADSDLQGDHILPLCRGGSNAFANLTTACRCCNQAKGSRMPDEWRQIKNGSENRA